MLSSSSSSSSPSLYPSIQMNELFPEENDAASREQVLIKIPGAVVHLIESQTSLELACGELKVVSLIQGDNTVAVFVRVGDDKIQWPLAKDEPAVKLDDAHYFFTLKVPPEKGYEENDKENEGLEMDFLNYGLTIASEGQDGLSREFDKILETYGCFSVKEVKEIGEWGGVDAREMLVGNSALYWTVLAPNVEDYNCRVAKMIAAGSGQVVRGILWCGDVTVGRLRWANEFLSKRMGTKGSSSEISPGAMRRLQRVKRLTKMSEEVVTGILSGVVKVSGFFTTPIVNSKVGKKFFSLMPGQIVLASLDGFSKVCGAVEVAGRNVMSTTSVVTTGLVSQRYGEQAGQATNEGLDAAGHAMGTAWAVLKIRKALDPKSAIKPTTLAKAAVKANSAQTKP